MPRFSANLGFLWQELSLCERIRAAKRAGFEAVECHWPYDVATDDVAAVLEETALPMLGLNTRLGEEPGDFGLSAVPGRETEARQYIDEAVSYAAAINCQNIHVMAGKSGGRGEAEQTYRDNLRYASDQAATNGLSILIEPINQTDVSGYHLSFLAAAIATITAVGASNIKIMFDAYHTQIMEGELARRLEDTLAYVGHVQIAAVPDRGEPDAGDVNYPELLNALDGMGYQGFVGAEYRPRKSTDDGLSWMKSYQR